MNHHIFAIGAACALGFSVFSFLRAMDKVSVLASFTGGTVSSAGKITLALYAAPYSIVGGLLLSALLFVAAAVIGNNKS